jgi:reductive dehalogenase
MHETLERETESLVAPDGTLRTLPPVPDFGRTVRVVGEVVNVDTKDTPHPKNTRGELGKALFNWYRNTVAKDPLTRVSAPNQFADKRNYLITAIGSAPKGSLNPCRTPVDDPAAMARHIKRAARHLGADLVGIAPTHPSFLYASGQRYLQEGEAEDSYQHLTPEELARRFPFVIVATCAWDYRTLQAHRHHIGDASYHVSQMRAAMIVKNLEGYVRELGYTALRGAVVPQGGGLAAGLGELGRNGMLISDRFGARIHMPDPILTDLPLVGDKPTDLGVDDFCKICRKCAITCPTNSITFEDKVVHNGIEKYKINWLTCYKLRPYVADYWHSCLTCVAVCPFTKPDVWWRRLAGATLKATPIPARPPLVRALKAIDDRVWGVVKQKRVRFMGYDSGIKPGQRACTIAGCTASHEGVEDSAGVADGNVGYYAPLKENTNRFVRRDKR